MAYHVCFLHPYINNKTCDFLGPQKLCALIKLKWLHKQRIVPSILQLNELGNLTWHGTDSVGLFFLRQVYFLYKLY